MRLFTKVTCLSAFFMTPQLLNADTGIPMIAVTMPILILALIPVIVIEFFVYNRHVVEKASKKWAAVSAANIVSTIIGYPLAWGVLLLIELLGYVLPHSLINGPFALLFYAAWLPPIDDKSVWAVYAAQLVGLIPAFFISVYSEYFIMAKILKSSDKVIIKKLSYKANLFSYGFLYVITIGLWAINSILPKS